MGIQEAKQYSSTKGNLVLCKLEIEKHVTPIILNVHNTDVVYNTQLYAKAPWKGPKKCQGFLFKLELAKYFQCPCSRKICHHQNAGQN